jgi:hypothetical protein
MNICFVNSNFNLGGVQKVIIDLANYLSKDELNNISLISLSEKDPFYTLEKDIQYLKYKNDTVTLIKNKIKKELSIKIKKNFL